LGMRSPRVALFHYHDTSREFSYNQLREEP
jgi:hypothetical protein